MSDKLRSDFAATLKDSVVKRAKDVWEELSELVKTEVAEALEDLAALTLAQFEARDEAMNMVLSREILHAKARIANWRFVGADIVREAVKQALKDAAELLGSFLKGLIR